MHSRRHSWRHLSRNSWKKCSGNSWRHYRRSFWKKQQGILLKEFRKEILYLLIKYSWKNSRRISDKINDYTLLNQHSRVLESYRIGSRSVMYLFQKICGPNRFHWWNFWRDSRWIFRRYSWLNSWRSSSLNFRRDLRWNHPKKRW